MPQTLEVKGKSGKVYEFPIPDGADMGAFQQKIVQFMSERGETNAPARPPAMVTQPPAQWDAENTPVNPMAPGLERRPSFTGNLKDFVGGVVGKLRGNAGPSARDAYTAKAQEAAAPRQESGRESVVRKAGGRPKPPLQMGDPDLLKRLVEEARAEEARKEAARKASFGVIGPGDPNAAQAGDEELDRISLQQMPQDQFDAELAKRKATHLANPKNTLQRDEYIRAFQAMQEREGIAGMLSPSNLLEDVRITAQSALTRPEGSDTDRLKAMAQTAFNVGAFDAVVSGLVGKIAKPVLAKFAQFAKTGDIGSIAREISALKPAEKQIVEKAFADFTPKAGPNYVSGEAPKLTEMGAKGEPVKAKIGAVVQKAKYAQQGEPITMQVFHGTPDARFTELKDRFGNGGIWFTDDRRIAATYADDRRAFDYQGAEPRVLTRTVTLQNPMVIDAGGASWKGTRKAIEDAKALGHDGIVIKNVRDAYSTLEGKGKTYNKPSTTVAIFDEKQIVGPAPTKAEIGGSTPPASKEPPVSAQTVKPEAPVKAEPPKPAETPKPKATPKGEQSADTLRVTVNGRTFDLEGEAKAAWLEEEKLHNARMARLKEQGAGPGDMKTAGMVHSARQREITGSLAPKEEANAFKKLKGNYVGKAVETPDGPGTVKGTAFGKIRVERADGTVASYLPEDLTAAKGAEDMSLPKGVSEVKAEPAPKIQASTRPSEALKSEKGKTNSSKIPNSSIPQTGKPFEFTYAKNKSKAPKTQGFDQHLEPAGNYVIEAYQGKAPSGWEVGTLRFENPLVMRWGESYGTPTNWKKVLSDKYGGKAGKDLQKALRADGYDGVVTVDEDGTREIVDLIGRDRTSATPAPPKPEPPKAGGISHEKVGQVRKDFGWEPTSKTTKTDAELAEGAKRYEGLEDQIAQSVMDDPKRVLKDEESLALGVRLQNLRKAMDKAKAAGDHEGYALLNEKALGIADALDKSGSAAGRALRARRFVVDSYDSFWLESGSRKANLGEAASGKRATEQAQIAAQLDSANKELAAQLEKARKEIELLTRTRTPRTGRATPAVRRTRALEALDKLGIQTAPRDTDPILGKLGQAPPQGKQSGFVAMPDVSSVQDKVKRNVMALIRSYGDDGAKNWDDIMTRLKQDLPGISEQEALFLVHEPYSKATADVYLARSNARKFMSGVQRDAEQRLKPLVVKVLDNALDFVSTTQRSMQTTLDNSLALIQGKGVLFYKPGTWFKAVGKSLKAGFRKDPIAYAEREMSKLEAHPLYAEFKQAGVEFSDLHGKYAAQEEALAGKLEDYVPGLTHSKAMATVLGNEMRFDTMRKLAAAYNGPAHLRGKYLEDMARMVNVLTGKGGGNLGKILASREGGLAFYAGRWTLSKWQQATGYAFWKAATKEGKIQAAKMYGTQLAAVSATVGAAQAFGWKVDLDPRSTGFGNAVSPDGTWEFDLFRSQGEPVRVIAQLLWGRISNAGNYKSPTEFGAYKPSDYLGDKGSPLLRMEEMLRTGETWDMATGERRTVKASDFWTAYIPLSIQENIRTMSDPRIGTAKGAGLIPLSFFGGNIGPAPKRKSDAKKAPPMSLLPPGMQKIIDGK